MYKYMVKHHKKPAKADIRNNVNLTPLGLASKLGRNRLFKEILEINSIVSKSLSSTLAEFLIMKNCVSIM